jgi:hypothetical protein
VAALGFDHVPAGHIVADEQGHAQPGAGAEHADRPGSTQASLAVDREAVRFRQGRHRPGGRAEIVEHQQPLELERLL